MIYFTHKMQYFTSQSVNLNRRINLNVFGFYVKHINFFYEKHTVMKKKYQIFMIK